MSDDERVVEAIMVTAEIMGQALSPGACAAMVMDLSAYPKHAVLKALEHVRKNHSGRLTLAVIIQAVEKLDPQRRLSADEAWAMMPRDEHATVVMTQEMSQALFIAQPLLNEGDAIAARMAYKEAYSRIVDQNKSNGVPVKWFVSLGFDDTGRPAPVLEAVRLGRIRAESVLSMLPVEMHEHALSLSSGTEPKRLGADVE